MAFNLVLVGALLGLPLLVMVERSLAGDGGYSLASYAALFDESARGALFVPPIEAVGNSLLFAAAAAAACLVLGSAGGGGHRLSARLAGPRL